MSVSNLLEVHLISKNDLTFSENKSAVGQNFVRESIQSQCVFYLIKFLYSSSKCYIVEYFIINQSMV